LKKIVVVLPLLGHGGGQRKMSLLANEWANLGHSVTIISLRKGSSFFQLNASVRLKCLDYSEISEANGFKRLMSRIRTLFELRKALKDSTPDLIISILSSTNVLTIVSSFGLKSKVFVWDVMSPFRFRTSLERLSRRVLYPFSDEIIVNTNKAKEVVAREISEEPLVFPSPIAFPHGDFNFPEREKILLAVGRLHPDKGHEDFLKVCSQLDLSGWRIVILGEGDLRDKLEQKAKELKIDKYLEMPGAVTNVEDWLKVSSIFCFTSKSESFGLSLVEAMSYGLPVIAFDCDVGPREIIRDEINGFLVPMSDIDGYVNQLKLLMQDDEMRNSLGESGRQDAKKYDVKLISRQILEIC
jgi:glycosyltransferase involved in cell wall biosynthesis